MALLHFRNYSRRDTKWNLFENMLQDCSINMKRLLGVNTFQGGSSCMNLPLQLNMFQRNMYYMKLLLRLRTVH